jgi:magnesium chelatase family protein
MNIATVYSRAITGIEAQAVTVEVHISNGLPQLSIVGYIKHNLFIVDKL